MLNTTGFLNIIQGWGIVSMPWSEQTIFDVSVTDSIITLQPLHSDGIGSASWITVAGITGCEGNTPWRNQSGSMLTSTESSCTFATKGTEVQWPTGNPLWTGIAVDPFVISYQQVIANPIPEPSTFAMLVLGLFCVLKRCGAFGESSWLRSNLK